MPLPAVPPELTAAGVTVRHERDDDRDFLCELFISTRWDEMEASGWPIEVRRAFLADQFRLQHLQYLQYANAAFGIVEANGERTGRLYIAARSAEIRIIDISFIPQWRGRGLGGRLIRAVQDQAASINAKVSIHVEQTNRAQGLYQRLGFRPVGEHGIYHLLEWQPVS